jgi:hypothetical protein
MNKSASAKRSQVARKKAVKLCGEAIGTSSVTARENASRAQTARDGFLRWMRTTVSPAILPLLGDVAERNTIYQGDFADIKKSARKAAKTEYQRLVTLNQMSPEHPAPKGTESEAEKNGSKGARQRRRPLENFQELLEVDPEVALDSIRERSANEPQLSWSERADIWAAPKRERCAASKQKIEVGTDSKGLMHNIADRDAYHIQKRTLEDGTEQEYCEVSVGSPGSSEIVEVVLGLRPSGEVYSQMLRVMTESRLLLRNASKFVRDCEDAETFERHAIPTVAVKDD